MQLKNFKTLSLLVIVFLTTLACGLTPTAIAPIIPGIALTNTPIPTIPTADACPTETAELKLLMNAEDGYCFLYPADDTELPFPAQLRRFVVINPASATADTPGDAWVDIAVEAAVNRTAAQVADSQIAAAGEGYNITRSEILVGGMQAIMVDGLPGPDPWRKVFIVSNDRLYTLNFMPWAPSADNSTPLEKLYSTVIETLHFLPPTKALPTTTQP